jgi:hypothetical protein
MATHLVTFKQHNCHQYFLQFSVKVLSSQKIPETAYKVSTYLVNDNKKLMYKERYNKKEKYQNVAVGVSMEVATTVAWVEVAVVVTTVVDCHG